MEHSFVMINFFKGFIRAENNILDMELNNSYAAEQEEEKQQQQQQQVDQDDQMPADPVLPSQRSESASQLQV
jgi:hypothetical protein